MAKTIVSNSYTSVLPSQKGLCSSEIALDCLEKMQALTLANFEKLQDPTIMLGFHQYLATLSDLTKIAISALEQMECSQGGYADELK